MILSSLRPGRHHRCASRRPLYPLPFPPFSALFHSFFAMCFLYIVALHLLASARPEKRWFSQNSSFSQPFLSRRPVRRSSGRRRKLRAKAEASAKAERSTLPTRTSNSFTKLHRLF